jgi:hypothetical protein
VPCQPAFCMRLGLWSIMCIGYLLPVLCQALAQKAAFLAFLRRCASAAKNGPALHMMHGFVAMWHSSHPLYCAGTAAAGHTAPPAHGSLLPTLSTWQLPFAQCTWPSALLLGSCWPAALPCSSQMPVPCAALTSQLLSERLLRQA